MIIPNAERIEAYAKHVELLKNQEKQQILAIERMNFELHGLQTARMKVESEILNLSKESNVNNQ